MKKRKYVMVGIGGRAAFYYQALASLYRETAEIVGFCDPNKKRMEYANSVLSRDYSYPSVPTYHPERFDQMIQEQKPDVVIVTSIDRTHHRYIIRAMELGCDVITEKPLTIDEEKLNMILETVERTKQNLRVTFNYRYAPHNSMIKELLMKKVIGDIYSVHFEWLLNNQHGADYFRRWHRDKRNSGGLLVHKATHHFDLVNFWLNTEPTLVYAQGDLNFYGKENAENRGITTFYNRGTGSPSAVNDPFALDLTKYPQLKEMYYDAESEDGYLRDQSVFGDGISIEDTMGLLIRYKNKAIMTYSLNAYLPWEGFRIAFNGSNGRLEANVVENSYINSSGDKNEEGVLQKSSIIVFPMFAPPYEVKIPTKEGGHGGGDPILLEDLFGTPKPDPLHRQATHLDGARSILTGIAGNISLRTGNPVKIKDLSAYI